MSTENVSSPYVPLKSDKPASSRVSRQQAIRRFLDATILLLSTKPISDITVQEISDTAGLNHGYVFRYFGTRLDLLEAVTIDLSQRARAQVEAAAEKRKKTTSKIVTMDMQLISAGQELT